MGIKDKYLTISEAARLLDVSRQTISRWIRAGKLKVEKVGRETLIEKQELHKFQGERLSESYGKNIIKIIFMAYTDYCWGKGYITMEEAVKGIDAQQGHMEITVEGKDGSTRIIKLTPGENKKVVKLWSAGVKGLIEQLSHVGYAEGWRSGVMERGSFSRAGKRKNNK